MAFLIRGGKKEAMRVYLDNCCFNRPFDKQSGIRIKLETDAKLFIQEKIQEKKIELAWSYMLHFENEANPFEEKKVAINKRRNMAVVDISETEDVLETAIQLFNEGLRAKDALHVSCAVAAQCAFFLTTDDVLLKKMRGRREINAINPVDFITVIEEQ